MNFWEIAMSIWLVFLVLVAVRVAYVFIRHRRSFNRGLFSESGSSGGSNDGGSDGWSDSGDSGGGGGD